MTLRTAAIGFLCVEGALGLVWCALLLAEPRIGAWFLPETTEPAAITTLFGADLVFFGLAPLAAALGLGRRRWWGAPLLVVVAGAVAYAALWAWGLFAVTGAGLAGAVLMSVPAVVLLVLAAVLPPGGRDVGLLPRVARPAGPLWNSLKTLLQTLAMWAVFLVALPAAVHALESRLGLAGWRFDGPGAARGGALVFCVFGAVGLYLGNLLAVRGHGTPLPFDTARRLVIAGPYRRVRNPMAMVSFAQGFGVALWLGSPLVVAYVLCGMAIWNYGARPWEEADLERRFGEAYSRYRDQVPCWRIRLRPYDPDGPPPGE